jgi:chromatin remodeling complex protein RSC6
MPPKTTAAAKTTAPAVSAAPAAPAKTVAATPAKPAAKPITKSAAKTVPTVVAPEPVAVTQAAAVPADTETKTDNTGETILNTLVEKVNSLTAQLKEVQNLIKLVGKEYDKQQKIIDKVQKKRQNAKNSPSGFAKPNKISNELCDFIGVPYGTEKSRTDITRFINAYVKEHNLNNPQNRRFIIPDAKLKAILNVKDGEEINYFILQKLISHHFPPSASKVAAKV